MTLQDKIERLEAQVGIIGLGYVGLPLAVTVGQAGYPVIGIDVSDWRVEAVNEGRSYIGDVTDEEISPLVQAGRLRATTDYAAVGECDVLIICVPTPLNETRDPDLSYIVASGEGIAAHMRSGQLIALESTTFPGTTEEVLLPILSKSGLEVGRDFFIAFSPERVDPGSKNWNTKNTPKVVGALTPAGQEMAMAFYGRVVDQAVPVSSPSAAEMTKIFENTFRVINMGLVNEIAMLCDRMGLSIWEIIQAASTKPFGFMPFYPGPGVGGHCLDGKEYVFLKNGHGMRALPLDECFEWLALEPETSQVEIRGTEALSPNGVKILSFDPEDLLACFRSLQHLTRRRYEGQMVQIETKDGRFLTVTDRHPMLVWDSGRLEVRLARELQTGEQLVVVGTPPKAATSRDLSVDLIEHIPIREWRKIRVRPMHGSYDEYREHLRPHLKALRPEDYWDIFRSNGMQLWLYHELEQLGVMPLSREEILLCTGRGSSWNSIPAVIPVDEEFARLIGYYLSEGCITQDKSLRTRFTFNGDETEYIEDVQRILTSKGIRFSTYRSKDWNALHIKVSSNLFGWLLRDFLACGNGSYDARVPSVLMEAPKPIREALVAGLLRGDGDVYLWQGKRSYRKRGRTYEHRMNTASVGYFSSSQTLFQQVVLLLQGLGYYPTFRRDKPYLRLYGEEQLTRMIHFFDGHKRGKLEAYRRGRSKRMPVTQQERHPDFSVVQIKDLHFSQGGVVYSAEVEGTHTFVTSFGIVTHNCIPIDPFYLTWKAREYDFHTRFIELAGEINRQMPVFVREKVIRALNDRGKALKGAKILLLGLAYKQDVADWRESPAFDVLRLLREYGAEVSCHDPYIPEVDDPHEGVNLRSIELTDEALASADCVVIITHHSVYDYQHIVDTAQVVVDTRNATRDVTQGREKIVVL